MNTAPPDPLRTVTAAAEDRWVTIAPHLMKSADARRALRRTVRKLVSIGTNGTAAQTVNAIRIEETALAQAGGHGDHTPDLALCINVLCDLRAQGWLLRVDRETIAALPPLSKGDTPADDKARVRATHLVERNAQLQQPAVRRFIREMERRHPHRGAWHSIFSLMRDGRELAPRLRHAASLPAGDGRNQVLRSVIDPYVQVVTPGAVCEWTGLSLADIWRYFRHTWTTTYQSTPGRKIFYLIRDRAAPNHPVIGIGALGSAIVQLSVRDEWIEWTGPRLVKRLRQEPTIAWARWLDRSLRRLVAGILSDDVLKQARVRPTDIARPTPSVIARLAEIAREERRVHRLYPTRGQHKKVRGKSDAVDWEQQSRTHLFRSKRASSLAELLEARRRLQAAGFTHPSVRALRRALEDPASVRAIHTVLRYTKAAHVGVDMMDVTVCGAIAPYNRILGGKLVSLLMASPDVVAAYNQRYKKATSIIASSMAGRAVRRKPHLVLLGTTSLYAAGASQYNRLRMPAEFVGGTPGAELAYVPLGRTAGYGSYHFSRDTIAAIDPVLRRLRHGRPVNSIFGEGVNPKLRKVRSALDVVGLPSDLLLQHSSPRLVYAVPLASNFREVLIGRSRKPDYILPDHEEVTGQIIDYWCDRWLARRIESADVLRDVESQSLAYPVRHEARVSLPEVFDEAGPLFSPLIG